MEGVSDKKHRVLLLILTISAVSVSCCQEPVIQAHSALLADGESGRVLWEKNPTDVCYPASLTKLMTALLAIEHRHPNELVTVPSDFRSPGGASLGLKPKERLRLYDLVAALLLQSANDAAVVIAQHVGGSVPGFVRMMNQRAWTLGMIRTRFTNPHGLHDPRHFTTARDLLRLARHAFFYQELRELIATKERHIAATNLSPPRILKNHNKLLWRYPYSDGVKTGFTNASGPCLIASATRDGWRLIAVILNSKDHYGDAQRLLDFGYRNFIRIRLAEAGTPLLRIPIPEGDGDGHLVAIASEGVETVVSRKDANRIRWLVYPFRLRPPIYQGQTVGIASLSVPGLPEQRIGLLASRTVHFSLRAQIIRFFFVSIAALIVMAIVQWIARRIIPSWRQ